VLAAALKMSRAMIETKRKTIQICELSATYVAADFFALLLLQGKIHTAGFYSPFKYWIQFC
jgi:hypothetical protein